MRVIATLVLFMAGSGAACTLPSNGPAPGMHLVAPRAHVRDAALVELARVDPTTAERALLVFYPRSACSASASAVVADERGHYLGAIAPGTASLLAIPAGVRSLALFSSVEVTASTGTWHDTKHVVVPAAPSGLVVRSSRLNARDCGLGPYFDVESATKEALEDEIADTDVAWLAPSRAIGQAWLDAHRDRIAELLTTPAGRPPGDITHLVVR